MKIERFEDIEAWQLARKLTQKVYHLTKKPGFAKDYGLKRQIQDAVGSSIHNINPAIKQTNPVMPDLIPEEHGIFDRHPVPAWLPAFAGMTTLRYLVAGAILWLWRKTKSD